MTDAFSRARLVSRIELEARAYRNADSTTKPIRMGRLLGLLETGAVLGYCSRRKEGGGPVRDWLPEIEGRVHERLRLNVPPTCEGANPAIETRPRARGWIHRISFIAAGPAGLVLLAVAPTWEARVAVGVYALTLAAMFWVSSTYHRGSWSIAAWGRWQRRDHAAIFLLIAGSYTPYCVLVLEGAWGPSMLAAAWIGAAVGVLVKLYRVDLHVLSGVMYLGLGWMGVVVFPQFVRLLTPAELILTVAGGILYTAGALVLALHKPNPFPRTFGYHEVWHAATAGAATCHYVAVLLILIGA